MYLGCRVRQGICIWLAYLAMVLADCCNGCQLMSEHLLDAARQLLKRATVCLP